MSYTIRGLAPAPFQALFGLSDEDLARRGVIRYVVDARPGFPCRITLEDAAIGETVLLFNHTYLDVASPYRGAHAIFVRESATAAAVYEDEIPASLRSRLLSIRAFDASHLMIDADVVEGAQADATIERFFADSHVAYLLAHNAKRGCFAARVERRSPQRPRRHSPSSERLA